MNLDTDKQRLLGDPPHLPLSVAIQVAYGSIRVRLSRSLVTVSSVVLAVTFLLVVLGGEISSNAVFRRWSQDIRPAEDATQVRSLLSQPRGVLSLITHLRDNRDDTRSWAASLDVSLPELPAEAAEEALIITDWLQSLRPSQRYLIIRNQTIGAWLLTFDNQAMSETVVDIGGDLTGTRLPLEADAIHRLALDKMPQLIETVRMLQAAEQARLQQVEAQGGAQAVIDSLLAGADNAALQGQGLPLSQLVLGIDAQRRELLLEQFRIESLRFAVQSILSQTRLSPVDDASEEAEVLPTLSMGVLVDGFPSDYPAQVARDIENEIEAAVGAEALQGLRQNILNRRTLDSLRSTFASMNYNPEEGKERTMWLVLLSLLVCIVGIVNSMMMAVTERFREIATMKCLGAMDGFILKTFMIESGSVGFVGAVLGALIGIILVLVQSTTRYGGSFWASMPARYLLFAALASLVCGLVLTIIGALLPAYKAARMHPIEAMRLEA